VTVIGIVGSRRRDTALDYTKLRSMFDALYQPGDAIVSGGCPRGADRFAERIAKELGMGVNNQAKPRPHTITIHRAQWQALGRTAGFVRNGDIARDADVLLACVAPDRTGGVEDTIRKFGKLGKHRLILV
jgi:hypothetical protein